MAFRLVGVASIMTYIIYTELRMLLSRTTSRISKGLGHLFYKIKETKVVEP